MNAALTKIVRDFSTFGYLFGPNRAKLVDWIADQSLKKLVTNLVAVAPWSQPDAWARYFLVHLRANDLVSLVPLLHPESWQHPVKVAIDSLIQVNPLPNQPMQGIDAQLAAASSPDITQFLDTPTPYAKDLLTAYLQKPCWYTAKQFYDTKVAWSSLHHRYSLEDCFQILGEQVSQPKRLLKAFRFDREHTSVKTYAEKKLQGVLRKAIADTALDACSNWSLLRYLSRKELVEALTAQGFTKPQINQYCLVWDCFQEVYQTKQIRQNQLPPPTQLQLEQIEQRYQKYQGKIEQSISASLSVCIQAVRAYRHPNAVMERTWQHSLEVQPDPLAALIDQEEIHQVRIRLEHCVLELSAEARASFYLWFGLELPVTSILEIMGPTAELQHPHQLLQRIKSAKRYILTAWLKKLRQQYPEYFSDQTGESLINKQTLIALDESLKQLCQDRLHRYLADKLKQLNCQQRPKLSYRKELITTGVKCSMGAITIDQANPNENNMNILVCSLKRWLETDLKIPVNDDCNIEDHLRDFIHQWLSEYDIFETGDKS
jgi:hypothetical protein